MVEESLVFNCYGCQMTLNMPIAMEEMPIGNLRKFFRFTDQEAWRNEESTRMFFSYIDEIRDDLKNRWEAASFAFHAKYQDERFDQSGNYISDKKERERRRNRNKRLTANVKEAKARYERFEKRVPKLEELREQYQH